MPQTPCRASKAGRCTACTVHVHTKAVTRAAIARLMRPGNSRRALIPAAMAATTTSRRV